MKTTIDIPEKLLDDAILFSGSRTKREIVVTALTEYNQRRRIQRLVKAFGTCDQFLTVDELDQAREEG